MPSDLLTIEKAAPLIKCSQLTLRKFIHAGKIGYKKVGKRYFITPDQIQEYLNSVDVPIKKGGANGTA